MGFWNGERIKIEEFKVVNVGVSKIFRILKGGREGLSIGVGEMGWFNWIFLKFFIFENYGEYWKVG